MDLIVELPGADAMYAFFSATASSAFMGVAHYINSIFIEWTWRMVNEVKFIKTFVVYSKRVSEKKTLHTCSVYQ